MSISTNCPECGKRLKAPDSAAGRKAKCPSCGAAVPIPEPVYDAEETFDPGEADEYGDDSYGLHSPDEYGAPAAPPPRRSSSGDKDRRPCPMCGEMILATASKCRYCGEIFDPALKKSAARRNRRESDGDMTAVDWILCVLCPGIGCIVGIVACIRGDSSRGGKMIGFGVLFGVLWNIVRAALESMNR